MLRLLPLSRREADGHPQASLPWEWEAGKSHGVGSKTSYQDIWKGFVRGSYSELVADPGRDIQLWHSSYTQTYLERDVRSLRQVGDLTQFQSFLRALASRSAQLINLGDLARDLGVAVSTVRAWLSVLEATYQVIVLRPYHANIGKRLVKTPKVYFTDVGTLCHLTGLKDPQHAAQCPMGGPLMETAVLSEIAKALTHRGIDPRLYFWRASTKQYQEFAKKGVDLGSRPDLIGGGLVRSSGRWAAAKSVRRRDVKEKRDERILGSGEFVEKLLDEAERKTKASVHGIGAA